MEILWNKNQIDMKAKLLFILTLTLLSCYALKGQSFIDQLRMAEEVKEQYGETDERYLDALAGAISAAFAEEKDEEANRLRLVHMDIVEKKYGVNSLEYAEDLWRLGNVSSYKGEDYIFDCYQRSAEIYETLGAEGEFPYCYIMWNMYWHYYKLEDWGVAADCIQKFISLCVPWIGNEWKGNSFSSVWLAGGYVYLGLVHFQKLHNPSLAIEAFERSVEVIEQNDLYEQYELSYLPYQGLFTCYDELENYEESVKWRLRYLDVVELLYGKISDEYIKGLSNLRFTFYSLGDIESIKKVSLELFSLIRQRDEEQRIDPQTDQSYFEAQSLLVSFCIEADDCEGVIEYAPALLAAYESRGEVDSDDYWDTMGVLISAYHHKQDYPKAYSLYDQYDALTESLGLKADEDYLSYLAIKIEALANLYKLDECEKSVRELTELTSSIYGENSRVALLRTMGILEIYESFEKYEELKPHLDHCFEILSSGEVVFSNTTDSLTTMMWLHYFEGAANYSSNPKLAEEKYLLAVKERESLGTGEGLMLSVGVGKFYYDQYRDYNRAIHYFEAAQKELEESGDNHSYNYYIVLVDVALCYERMGETGKAMAIYDLAGRSVEINYGRNHPLYGIIEQNKTLFYSDIGDNASAIACCRNALDCMENVYGKESEKYAVCLLNLGVFYKNLGDLSASEEALLQGLQILEDINSPNSVLAYISLFETYYAAGEMDICAELIGKIEEQILAKGWESTDTAALFYESAGFKIVLNGNPEGEKYMDLALGIWEDIGFKSSLTYYYSLIRSCLVSFRDNSQSEEFISLLLDAYKEKYLNDVAFLNSNERETLISGSGFSSTKNIMFSSRQSDTHDGQLFDFLLFNKGLLLGTSVGYAKAVYNSGDERLIEKYKTLQNFNRYLNGENVALAGTYTAEEAKAEASRLEREITVHLRRNEGYTDELDYSYEDVRNALGDDEIAIEFVNYTDYTDDTDYYAALAVKKDWAAPKYVSLCKKGELDKMATQSPSRLYDETFVSHSTYELIWAPLEPYFDSVKTVYFSPAGHISGMAVELLYDGEKRFNETYNAVRLTSTREICNKTSQRNYAAAVLYGGLTYDEDEETLIAESRNVVGDVGGFRDRFRGFDEGTTRGGWIYLPGTLEEVNRISSVLGDAALGYDLYSSEKGNEESFKALSGNDFEILHLATHGFYMTASEAERSDLFSSYAIPRPTLNPLGISISGLVESSSVSPVSTDISPLQRSGLILSGGNRMWLGENIPDGVEDGILTAAEIANLDFSSCDIVVMSACETGLGEITDEGVFGLQRAFKNAGVNTIVMSLWAVDDTSTNLLMQTFYQNLVSGMSKREAFLAAQEKVHEQYPDPRYWAAFIMLD